MSVKTKTYMEKINSEGYVSIGELMDDFVYLQPPGVHLSKMWMLQENIGKTKTAQQAASIRTKFRSALSVEIIPELAKDTTSALLGEVYKSLKLEPTFKMYPQRNLMEYSKLISNVNAKVRAIAHSDFENEFYARYRKQAGILYISNAKGNISLRADLVYKFVKLNSPFGEKHLSFFFQPSSFLSEEKDLWKLVAILGEDFFNKQLDANHNLVNERFITDSFARSEMVFQISRKNKKIFAMASERVQQRNDDLEEISLSKLLEIENADVGMVEEILEKGEKRF